MYIAKYKFIKKIDLLELDICKFKIRQVVFGLCLKKYEITVKNEYALSKMKIYICIILKLLILHLSLLQFQYKNRP